jgi:hypothetical protein
MKITGLVAVILVATSAVLRWTPLGARLRRRWSTVVRMERRR